MFQLALQCSCVPSGSAPNTALQEQLPADASKRQQYDWYQRHNENFLPSFFSLLPNFRRTYIVLDGLEYVKYALDIIPALLEQDFGNVSIAVFSRLDKLLGPILELADVSIRLLTAEPSPDTLRGYCRSRMDRKVEPELVAAGFRQPKVWLDDIENAICNASDGL